MISEAMGKILGMAMAYGVSALGLFLAYVNYRRRVVKAERVMTGTSWAVLATVALVLALGVWTVANLTARAAAQAGVAVEQAPVEHGATVDETVPDPEPAPAPTGEAEPEREAWTWIGVLVPAAIFLLATWVTAALHHRFAAAGPPAGPPPPAGDDVPTVGEGPAGGLG